jgi:hypothetical protein
MGPVRELRRIDGEGIRRDDIRRPVGNAVDKEEDSGYPGPSGIIRGVRGNRNRPRSAGRGKGNHRGGIIRG